MKRRARLIVAYLLAGIGINVLLAWCLSIAVDRSAMSFDQRASEPAELKWPTEVPANWPPRPDLYKHRTGFGVTSNDFARALPPTMPRDAVELVGHRAGWPFRALEKYSVAVWDEKHAPPQTPMLIRLLREGIPLPSWMSRSKTLHESTLPLRPVLPGFAFNSIVFSLAIFGLGRGWQAVRGYLRLRAGLCPACKYPIGASPVCTECGAQLPLRNLTA